MFKKINIEVWLSYFISVIISAVVVIHSYNYLSTFFQDHTILLISVISVIELGYISLPYIASLNPNRDNRVDLLFVVLLFALSVIPATLQTTDGFTKTISGKILEMPINPITSNLLILYETQISDINKQINANIDISNDFKKMEYLTKANQTLAFNAPLNKRKQELTETITTIQINDLKKHNTYLKRLEEYNLAKKKRDFMGWFDVIKILWALVMVGILQLVNGRFVYHGTQILQQGRSKKELMGINTKELMPTKQLLSNYKVDGLGEVTATSFIERFNIWDDDSLIAFAIDENAIERLNGAFTRQKVVTLKKLCTQIKRTHKLKEGKM